MCRIKTLPLIIVLALLSASIVSSCKKETKTPVVELETQGMKFTVNDTALSYNSCRVQNFNIDSKIQTQITGQNTTDIYKGYYYFTITIYRDMNSLKAGDAFQVETSSEEANAMFLAYSPDPSAVYFTQALNPQGKVTITSLGSGFIQGTFSGQLFDAADLAGAHLKYTITEGTFTAKMQ